MNYIFQDNKTLFHFISKMKTTGIRANISHSRWCGNGNGKLVENGKRRKWISSRVEVEMQIPKNKHIFDYVYIFSMRKTFLYTRFISAALSCTFPFNWFWQFTSSTRIDLGFKELRITVRNSIDDRVLGSDRDGRISPMDLTPSS